MNLHTINVYIVLYIIVHIHCIVLYMCTVGYVYPAVIIFQEVILCNKKINIILMYFFAWLRAETSL